MTLDEDLEEAAGSPAPGDPVSPGLRRARAWLSRAAEPGTIDFWRYVMDVGPVEAVRRLRSGQAPERVRSLVGARAEQDATLADLTRAERCGARLVIPEDDEWPALSLHVLTVAVSAEPDDPKHQSDRTRAPVPPLALWVLGAPRLDELVDRSVAIVGSRASTAYGEHVAGELGHQLGQRGWTVVSGEWPPGCAPLRHRFLVRNRLIAALTRGTVVVEAAARSGAQATAQRARRLGREVLVVPGPVTSAMSVGCHELLRDREAGATLVASADHVIEAVGDIGTDLADPVERPAGPRDGLSDLAARVLDACPVRTGVSPERLAAIAGCDVLEVLRVLPALELADLVQWTGTGWRLHPPPRRTGGPGAAA